MAIEVRNLQNRRSPKAVVSIVLCVAAYAGAISLSARDQALDFRAKRSMAPAMAAVDVSAPRTTTLAVGVPSVVKATIASAR